MASTKFQLEESKKPNPRYVLELHTIRGMVQEADNMDKGLSYVLNLDSAIQRNPLAPQTSTYSRAKPMGPVHFKRSLNANLEAALPAPAVASIPTSSTLVNTKGDVKKVREAEADGTTLEVASAPSPKRVKSDWEGPPNEGAQKHDEQFDNF